jgi:NAD(P)H dehydrogenase (quinone)
MIIVTGAAGQLGRGIVDRLLERVPADQVGVSVRDPEKAADLRDRGVRVRRGDFGDALSLEAAFEGASQVLIVSSNAIGEESVQYHRTAIEAAQKAGAERILYTSHQGSNPASPFAPMPDHAATEAILQSSGVPFTALRNGFYADNGLRLLGQALTTGTIVAPEDGPVSWTTHADLAEAAAIILTQEGRFDGLSPALTAAEALTLADVAEIASEVTGRTITRVTVSDEEWKNGLVSHGVPEDQAAMLVGLFAASRQGGFATVDPTLADLLGRPPISMFDVLTAAA